MKQRTFKDFVADFGVYLFCLIGVALSRYIPEFKAGIEPEITFSWFRMTISAVVAVMVAFGFDIGGDPAGKRQRWIRRAAFALSQGFMWEQLVG